MNKSLTISYFGCIDPKYSRNQTNIWGLRQAGVTVHEVIVNVPLTPLNASQHLAASSLVLRLLKKFLILPEIVRKRSVLRSSDAIFVGYPGQFDMPFAWLTAKLLKKPLIFDPVILMFNALSNDIGVITQKGIVTRLLEKFEKIVMNLPDLIIASTIEQKQFFIDRVGVHADKVAVVYLAADDRIYFPPKTPKKSDGKFTVVYYGLFTPLHGLPHVIEAARLCQKNSAIVFQLIGKGQLYQEIREMAEKLQLSNVEFYPDSNESNSMEMLQGADVFLGFMESNSTVLREIPNKVYQGLALGKVVITGDSPAIRSVFTDGKNICLVPPANARALAVTIQELAKHPVEAGKISAAAQAIFQEKFTIRATGEELRKSIAGAVSKEN